MSEHTSNAAPAIERWIYGGLRLNGTKQVHAWLPEPAANETLGEELWYGHKGTWVVGGIYHANVARHDQGASLYGKPSLWLQRYEDRRRSAGGRSSTGRPGTRSPSSRWNAGPPGTPSWPRR